METMKRREEGILEVIRREISPTSHKNYVFDVCSRGNEKNSNLNYK
jgi:hypothetical protein